MAGGFWGVGERSGFSLLTGRRLGVVADESVKGADSVEMDLVGRLGLESRWVLPRDRSALPDACATVVRRGLRAGEVSREAAGDWLRELVAEE